jgi:hypothetical protein
MQVVGLTELLIQQAIEETAAGLADKRGVTSL